MANDGGGGGGDALQSFIASQMSQASSTSGGAAGGAYSFMFTDMTLPNTELALQDFLQLAQALEYSTGIDNLSALIDNNMMINQIVPGAQHDLFTTRKVLPDFMHDIPLPHRAEGEYLFPTGSGASNGV